MPYLKHMKNTENFMEVLVGDHNKYRPIVEILDNIVKGAGELNWLDFEEIAIAISKYNCSGFCSEIHRGTRDFLKKEELSVEVNENIDILIAFSLKLSEKANEITEVDVQELRNKGWNDQTIEDIIGWVASINLYNIMANGLGFSDKLSASAFDEMGKGTIEQDGFLNIFDLFASHSKDK